MIVVNLNEIIYLIIKPDGTYNFITRNNQYTNHYQYLQELSKQDEYLKTCSFGLIFERDNNLSNILFFKELVSDGCLIFENLKILSSEDVSSVCFYLPNDIYETQDVLLNPYMDEINRIKHVFLEKYEEEIKDFRSVCKNIEEIKSGSKILKEYIKIHKQQEENRKK